MSAAMRRCLTGLKRAVSCLLNGLTWLFVSAVACFGVVFTVAAFVDLVDVAFHITTGAFQ